MIQLEKNLWAGVFFLLHILIGPSVSGKENTIISFRHFPFDSTAMRNMYGAVAFGNITHPFEKIEHTSGVGVPNISYMIPSSLLMGSAVSFLPTNTGGAVYAEGDVGLLAGSGSADFAEGAGPAAHFHSPNGVVSDAVGNIYVADTYNHRIRRISPSGVVTTVAGGTAGSTDGIGTLASMYFPTYIAIDGVGDLYVTDRGNHRIRKITPAGVVTTFAGSIQGYQNGTGTAAQFNTPSGIAIDASGNVYVADELNQRIRKITPAGVVTTLAGSGVQGNNNGTGTAARFNYPKGIAIDLDGHIYVADYMGNRIRKISPTGVVSTLAGTGATGSTDGSVGAVTFNRPFCVTVDAGYNVYVVSLDNKVRRVYPWGSTNTLAGTGSAGYANGTPGSAMFNSPGGIFADGDGTLYIGDTGNNRIRKIGSGQGYTIEPALPAGLALNKTTGAITGVPAVSVATTAYTVTANNADGNDSFTFSFSVLPLSGPSAEQTHVHTTTYLEPFTTPPLSPTPVQAYRHVHYIDGLGRPLQDVAIKASPMQSDVVQPYVYDSLGRQSLQYLPYTVEGGLGTYRSLALSGGEQTNYYGSPPIGVASTGMPYSRSVHETAPAARIMEQGGVGEVWQPVAGSTAGHTNKVVYSSNTSNEVRLWTVTSTGSSSVYYVAGRLLKQTYRDENWQSSEGRAGTQEVFQDQEGRIILVRAWETDLVAHSTTYIYDDRGRVRYVLTPVASMDGSSERSSFVESDAFFADQVYAYRYDDRDRPIARKMPGKGWEYFVYNKLDQLVAMQDAVQRSKSPQQWTVAKYDALGRNILTGIYHYGSTAGTDYRNALQDSAYNGSQSEVRTGTGYGYSSQSWPRSAIETMLTLTYYDTHSIPGLPATYLPSGYNTNTQGLPTAARVKVLDEGTGTHTMLWVVNHYDEQGRPERQFRQHYKDGLHTNFNYDEVINTYSFTDQPLTSTRRHYSGTSGATLQVQVLSEYDYDHAGRPLRIWKTTGSGARTLVSAYTYNELGQVRMRSLHSTNSGGSFGQVETLGYNERGWLTLDSTALLVRRLRYNEGLSGATPQYNGRISRQEWQHNGQASQQYTYMYDRMGRLRSGLTASGVGESVRYDRMGNIDTLWQDDGAARKYHYVNGSNRLNNIAGGLATGTYAYDANGNTLYDGRLGRSLRYNVLGLVDSVGGSPVIRYTYDAWGRKLRTVSGTIDIDYVDGIEWTGGSLTTIAMEEGRIINTGSGYHYEYYLRDQVGSLRSAFRSDQVTQASHRADYTPFGRRHVTGQLSASPVNRYLYSGKELQDGTGLYDYGARQYDPSTGRWGAIDPLADAYVGMTPYGFVGNDPVNYLDPDGRKIDGASSGHWSREYMSWREVIMQGERDLADLEARHESGEEGLASPIMTIRVVLERAYQYIGLLERLAASTTTYSYTGSNWSILIDEVEVTRQQPNAQSSGGGYGWGRVGDALTAGGVAYYGLEKSISNSKYWVDAKGGVRSTELLERGANGKYVRGVQGLRNSQAAAARAASNYAVAGKVVGGLGIGVTIWEIGSGRKNLIGEGGLDLVMGGIGFTGWGTPVSLIYFGGKWVLQEAGNDFWNK